MRLIASERPGLAVLAVCAVLMASSNVALASSEPPPPPPPEDADDDGYRIVSEVGAGGSPGDQPPERQLTCTYDEVQVLSNSRAEVGPYMIVHIDGMRFRFDSVRALAWVWSYETCRDARGTIVSTDTVWHLLTVVDPALGIEPAYDEAVDMIELPEPLLSPTVRGVVNLGMWLAVAEQDPIVARAEIATAWAEVRATQTLTTFDFGNGDVVTCDELGTPIPRSRMDTVEEGPCGYTYRSANDGEPYTITITSTWAIEWELSDGRTGTRPDVTLSSSVEYPVIEIQTVGTGG